MVLKIHSLGEKFSPSKTWYVKTMNTLFEMGGNLITHDICSKFIKVVSDFESEADGEHFRESTIKLYAKILKKKEKVPSAMMTVIAWIMGEHAYNVTKLTKVQRIAEDLSIMSYFYFNEGRDQIARAFIITAVTRLMARLGFPDNDIIDTMISDFSRSKDLQVQLRCAEYEQIYALKDDLPEDCCLGSTPLNIATVTMEDFDYKLSFLEDFVAQEEEAGKSKYKTKKRNQVMGEDTHYYGKKKGKVDELKFRPYEQARVGGVAYPPSNTMQSTAEGQTLEPSGRSDLQIGDVRKIWQGSEEGAPPGEQTQVQEQ